MEFGESGQTDLARFLLKLDNAETKKSKSSGLVGKAFRGA